MKIFWTEKALNQLEDIFNYYKVEANIKFARKLTKGIVDCTILLEHNQRLGKKEELLKDSDEEFRFLIEGNYKVIYWIETKTNLVHIASVFDCRQNPNKIINI